MGDPTSPGVLVSVVVATYRRDCELRNALDSLSHQTHDPLEIIVVDDSADSEWNAIVRGIVETVQAGTAKRFVYIGNESRGGSAETRNVGIRAANGEYVTFLDDDDLYLPAKIAHQVAHMIREQADYCITDLQLYSESDRLVEYRRRHYIASDDPATLLRYHFMYHMTGTDTLMFRRGYLLKLGGFPPIDVGDEFYLMREAIMAGGRFSYLPVCDVRAYVHSAEDGLSSGRTKIDGENVLFEYKQLYFAQFDLRTVRYIRTRHWAVLAFAEMRRRHFPAAIAYATRSFLAAPIQCASLLLRVR